MSARWLYGVLLLVALILGAVGYYLYVSQHPAPLPQSSPAVEATHTAAAETSSKESGSIIQYTDPSGFSFWYPSGWRVHLGGGLDGDPHTYLDVDSPREGVFEFTYISPTTTPAQSPIAATIQGLPIYAITGQGANERGHAIPAYTSYLVLLTPSSTLSPAVSMIVSKDGVDPLPFLKTITSAGASVPPGDQTAALQAEKNTYSQL